MAIEGAYSTSTHREAEGGAADGGGGHRFDRLMQTRFQLR